MSPSDHNFLLHLLSFCVLPLQRTFLRHSTSSSSVEDCSDLVMMFGNADEGVDGVEVDQSDFSVRGEVIVCTSLSFSLNIFALRMS